MTGMDWVMWTALGLLMVMVFVCIVSALLNKVVSKDIEKVNPVYYAKLSNTDTSIQNAMNNLKLTNGLGAQLQEKQESNEGQQSNGEQL